MCSEAINWLWKWEGIGVVVMWVDVGVLVGAKVGDDGEAEIGGTETADEGG